MSISGQRQRKSKSNASRDRRARFDFQIIPAIQVQPGTDRSCGRGPLKVELATQGPFCDTSQEVTASSDLDSSFLGEVGKRS